MSPALRALRIRNFRLFASGQVVSQTGTWMQRTAQDWLVLSLSGDSGLALGIVTGLQFLPMFLFGLYGGVVADRYSKRQILMATQIGQGLLALILGVLDVAGAVSLWQVYVLAFGLGAVSAFDQPARQTFVEEMVGKDDLPNAVSINSMTFSAGRVIGPAIAGLLISGVGTGLVFLLNAASFVAVLTGLQLMRVGELRIIEPSPKAKGQLREGIHYVRQHDRLLLPIILVGIVAAFGFNFQVTLPLMAKVAFHRGASSYGLASSALAIGALLGALTSARRSGLGKKPDARDYLKAATAFGVLEALSGFMPNYWLFAALLIPTGITYMVMLIFTNTALQLTADPQFRGRVLGIYMLMFAVGTPLGAPLIGAMGEGLGARSPLIIGGAVSAATAVACYGYLARHRRTQAAEAEKPTDAVDAATAEEIAEEMAG